MSNAPFLARDYPYLDNVNIEHRLIGFQATLVPFLQNTSGGRLDMYSSHVNQSMVTKGAEFPDIFSGYEQNLGQYEFTTSERDQDVEVLAVIPKYAYVQGHNRIRKNPSITVIYRGIEDNKIGYFTVDSYTKCSDGFGYENKYLNSHLLNTGFIPKEEKLTTSPIHKDGLYCQGINVNVAYMTLEDTIEDAMLISESLAAKMETAEIHRDVINIRPSQHPLNSYGDETEFKIFPDIGEFVREDGVLAGFRNVSEESFIPDTTASALETPQFLHDDVYFAPPGAEILDMDFYVCKTAKMPKHLFSQVDKYQAANIRYWQEIITVHQKFKATHQIKPEFNTLVSTAIKRLISVGVSIPGYSRKSKNKLIGKNKRPIEFIQVAITYMHKRDCSNGFKITGRDGSKGVIGRVAKDEDMPTDENGFRADLVIDPASIIARMSTGQLNEQAINRTSEFIRRGLNDRITSDPVGAWNYLIEYYSDINPNYANLIRDLKSTPEKQLQHMNDCIKKGICLHIPPGLDTIGMKLIKKLKDKYNIPISPVTFTTRDKDGNVIKTFKTKRPVCIGSKYVYLLCKIPEPSSAGIAKINQFGTPMKITSEDRLKSPGIRMSPIRFGEDEVRIMSMDLKDTSEMMRLMCLQANSPKGVDALVKTLLTAKHPTRIDRVNITNEELINSNTVVKIFHHMMTTIGIGMSRQGHHPISEHASLSDKVEEYV